MIVVLSLETPIASLLQAAGVTRSALARALRVAIPSVKDGPNVKLSTLVRAVRVLGYELKIELVKL